jgi:hypothetical protein
MNKYLLFFLTFCFDVKINAQLSPQETETKEWISILRQSTVAFGVDTEAVYQDIDGQVQRKRIFYTIGTGVIFYVKAFGIVVPCIVTAKHVLLDKQQNWKPKSVSVRFNQSDTLPIDKFFGDRLDLYDSIGQPTWFEHPDLDIDLACILLDPSYNWPVTNMSIVPYSYFASDDEYYEGKEIFVLGYPGAVGFDLLNRAVVRRGTIAWVPTKVNSDKKLLIDCNIFPGNSGGPVFSIPHDAGTIMSDTIFHKPKFYGIVSQRRFANNPIFSQRGQINDSSGNPISSLESIGIGVIITGKKVIELLTFVQKQLDSLVEQREKRKKISK